MRRPEQTPAWKTQWMFYRMPRPESRGIGERSLPGRGPRNTFWIKEAPLEVIDRISAS